MFSAVAKKKNQWEKSSSRLFLTKCLQGGTAITDAAGDIWIVQDVRLLNKWLQNARQWLLSEQRWLACCFQMAGEVTPFKRQQSNLKGLYH